MNFWTIILMIAFMTGIMGWVTTPFVNGILWYCDWREGNPINWGMEAVFTMLVPFAWIFALVEIVILYVSK